MRSASLVSLRETAASTLCTSNDNARYCTFPHAQYHLPFSALCAKQCCFEYSKLVQSSERFIHPSSELLGESGCKTVVLALHTPEPDSGVVYDACGAEGFGSRFEGINSDDILKWMAILNENASR